MIMVIPTVIEVDRCGGPGGHVRTRLSGSAVRPRRLPDEAGRVRVALVAGQALLLAGDEVSIAVRVGAGVDLEIVETAGTVAHDMRGGRASWQVGVDVADDASLIWDGRPFVVAQGARVDRTTTMTLAGSAWAAVREVLVLGRTGEAPGLLHTRTETVLDGRPLSVESLTLDAAAVADPALLGGNRCLDSVLLAGRRSGRPGALQLEGTGSIDRCLVRQAHLSDLDGYLSGEPLLWKGDDFSQTGVRSARAVR